MNNVQLAGIIELENWLQDLIQQGLAIALSRDTSFWEEFAARMVNAKLSGMARRIRSFKNWIQTDHAHERLLQELSELYLFCKATQKFDTFSPDLQQEILTTAGATVKKETVLAQSGISDQWLVIGQHEGKEEDIRFRRTWLHGITTHHTALLIDFAWRFQDFTTSWTTGHLLQGELMYYPSTFPQRALLKTFERVFQPFDLHGYADWQVFARHYAEALAANPWLLTFPCLLDAVTPALENQQLLLMDINRNHLSTATSEQTRWKILALSGGHPTQLFGEWDGRTFTPLSLIHQNQVFIL